MNPLYVLVAACLSGPGPDPSMSMAEAQVATAAQANEPAERLLQQAHNLATTPRTWRQAARLYERSAGLRSDDDPGRFSAYSMAGHVYAHADALDAAQRAFEKAAESAARIGALTDAADAYLDAAHVAARRSDLATARTLVRKGAMLARSPHLNSVERAAILSRIGELPSAG
jgi:tetratricopeptide (TPR) repeat protein